MSTGFGSAQIVDATADVDAIPLVGSQTRRAMLNASGGAACTSPDVSGWSRRGFLGVLAALAGGTVAGCAVGGSHGPGSDSVAGNPGNLGAPAIGGKRHTSAGADYRQGPPYSLDVQCVLSQDQFLVQNHPIDPNSDTAIAYSRLDGQVEAVVLQKGVITQFYRDSAAPAGWSGYPLPGAVDVKSMVAAVSTGSSVAANKRMLKVYYTKDSTLDPTNKDKLFEDTLHLDTPGQVVSTRSLGWSAAAGDLKVSVNYDGSLLVAAMEESPSGGGSAALHYATDLGGTAQAGSIHGFDFTYWNNGGWAAVGAVTSTNSQGGNSTALLLSFPSDPDSGSGGLEVWGGPITPVPTGWQAFDAKMLYGELPQGPGTGQGIVKSVEYATTLGSGTGPYAWPTLLVWTQRYSDEIGFYGHPWLWSLTYDPTLPYSKWVWTDLQVPEQIVESPLNIPVTTSLVPRSTPPAGGRGAAQLMDVFIALAGTLHVLRQVEQDPISDARHPTYTPMIPLQPGVATMTSQPAVSTGNELIVVGTPVAPATDHTLQTLEKDPVSGRWTDTVVHLPATDVQENSSYRVTLTLTDTAWNAGAGGQDLTITASSPAVAAIEGPSPRTVLLGADPVTVSTDHDGEVVLALLADGLSAPTLTVLNADLVDSQKPLHVCPSAPVNTYMTGVDKLNYLDPMSQGTLANATTPTGDKVSPGATGDKDTVDAMQQAARVGANAPQSGVLSSTIGHPDGNRVRHHSHNRAHNHDQPPNLTAQQLTSEISSWMHDALHAIKKGALAVERVAVDIGTGVATLAADAKQWTDGAITFTIKGIEDAAHVLHAALNKLAGEIVHAVKWLEAEVMGLLRDAKNVAKHFNDWLAGCADFIQTQAQTQENNLLTWLTNEQDNVDRKFRDWAKSFGAGASLQDLADNKVKLGTAQRRRLQPKPRPALSDASDPDQHPHKRWFLQKAKHDLLGNNLKMPEINGFGTSIANFAVSVEQAFGDFLAGFKELWGFFKTMIRHPNEVATLGLQKLLGFVADMVNGVFELVRAVVKAMLDLFAALAGAIPRMLTDTTLGNLPLLGPLLKLVGLDGVTMAWVASIIFAFPATLVYKIEHGGSTHPFAYLDPKSSQLLGDAESDMHNIGAAVLGVWTEFDVVAAAYTASKSDPPTLFAAIDIAAPLIITGLTAPDLEDNEPLWQAPFAGGGPDSLAFFSWLLGAVPSLVAAGGLYVDHYIPDKKAQAKPKDSLVWMQTAAATFSMVLGLLATSQESTPSGTDYALAVFDNLAGLCAAGLTDTIVEDSEGLSAVIVMAITEFSGLAASVMTSTV